MFEKFILKVSDRVYKVIDNQNDLEIAKYFIPSTCQMNINEFLNI